ncbi:MAG: Cyclic nucleotide-binding protein, partial [Chthonomonadales bacterium]|nr:Cyclic nucleotide-binding protein [Chthonomonadales bacterium]
MNSFARAFGRVTAFAGTLPNTHYVGRKSHGGDCRVDMTLTSVLRKVPLFAGLDEASLLTLAQHSRRRRFPPGETLFHEGDPGYTLYVIISGRV